MSLLEQTDTTSEATRTAVDPAPAEPESRPIDAGARDDPSRIGPTDDETEARRPRRRDLRIGRIRVRSVAKIAAVFVTLGYVVSVGTAIVVWSVLARLGFVDDVERLVVDSLGVDSFEIVGSRLFDLFAIGAGVAFASTFAVIVLLAMVYNATCLLMGGLAIEITPVRGWRRHRRLVRS